MESGAGRAAIGSSQTGLEINIWLTIAADDAVIAVRMPSAAYRDGKGMLHAGPEKAPLADLADVLGRVGEEGGMTAGVAKLLFEKREDIERVFAEHDAMIASTLRDETELGDIMPIGDAR